MKMSRVYVDVWDKLERHEREQFLWIIDFKAMNGCTCCESSTSEM